MIEGTKPTVSFVWLRGIGKLRDGILVFGGATYALGYLVWSINAKTENLGLLPALESQYLAAGVTPMLLIWLAYFGFRGAIQLPEIVAKWRDRQPGNWPKVWRGAGVACWVAGYALTEWVDKAESMNHSLGITISISIILLFFGGCILWFYPSAERGPGLTWVDRLRSTFQKVFVRFFMLTYLAGFLVVLALIYFQFYRRIPQEFGGVRPRCAYIDIAKDQLSEATRREILQNTPPSNSTVAQSYPMTVYFSGSEFMLARRDLGKPRAGQAEPPKPELVELRKDVIKAVHWCD